MSVPFVDSNDNNGEICLTDSAITHTILKDKKYFSHLIMQETNVSTISSSTKMQEGFGRANILLFGRTKLHITSALYSTKSQRNLLSFKDIRQNGYHIETTNEENIEYLYITKVISNKKYVFEKLLSFSSWLHYTYISTIETNVIIN